MTNNLILKILSMSKTFKPLSFNHKEYKCDITFRDKVVKILLSSLQNRDNYEVVISNQSDELFPQYLKLTFLTIQNIYWHFRDIVLNYQQKAHLIYFREGVLELKVTQNIAGIDFLKTINIAMQLTNRTDLTKSMQMATSFAEQEETEMSLIQNLNVQILSQSPTISKSDQNKFETIHGLTKKYTIMSQRLLTVERELSILKNIIKGEELAVRLTVLQKKQQIMISKMMTDEEELFKVHQNSKQTKAMFERNIKQIWHEINNIQQDYDKPPTHSSNANENSYQMEGQFNRTQQYNINSGFKKKQTENQLGETEDKPIFYIREASNVQIQKRSRERSRHSSLNLTEEELEKLRMGTQNLQIFKKKLKELDKRIQTYISPKQLCLSFKNSPYIDSFKLDRQKNGWLIIKKSVDKKCQLVGQPLPQFGKCFFRIKLISLPHGYIHIGIISGKLELKQTSYTNQLCINYFGGNGSLNDKGNGAFIGKQLQNGDILTVLVNIDNERVKFLVKNQLLCEASLKGMEKQKGLLPYVQLYYGGSKIEAINE